MPPVYMFSFPGTWLYFWRGEAPPRRTNPHRVVIVIPIRRPPFFNHFPLLTNTCNSLFYSQKKLQLQLRHFFRTISRVPSCKKGGWWKGSLHTVQIKDKGYIPSIIFTGNEKFQQVSFLPFHNEDSGRKSVFNGIRFLGKPGAAYPSMKRVSYIYEATYPSPWPTRARFPRDSARNNSH